MQMSALEAADAPRITLAGRAFMVPPLVVAQQRRILPLMAGVSKLMASNPSGEIDLAVLDDSLLDAMFDICFFAIADPNGISREDFERFAIQLHELVPAMQVIVAQTGLFKGGNAQTPSYELPGDRDLKGEARARRGSIGTSSSPTSRNRPGARGTKSKTL